MADPVRVVVEQPVALVVKVVEQGPPGAPGVGGADISPDPDNALQARGNGLFVPQGTQLKTTDW